MRRLVMCAATCLTLLACGSPRHVRVKVGDTATLDVHRAGSGKTALSLSVGPKDCRPTKVDVTWDDVAARLRAC